MIEFLQVVDAMQKFGCGLMKRPVGMIDLSDVLMIVLDSME